MDNNINVCLACDNNYAAYAGVVIASVLYNAEDDDKLVIYVLDGGIQEENKAKILSLKSIKDCEINFVPIDENMFEDYKSVKTHDYISLATYYRLKLPSLLPDVKRVIYYDCDFVVNTSLKELFNTNTGKAAVAGVRDIDKKKVRKNPKYVNAGMLIFDIENMKEQNLEQKFLDWTRSHIDTIKLGDQEIINSVLEGEIVIVPDEWNVQSSNFVNRSSYTNNPKAIHFTARRKPWHWASFSIHKSLYFKYLQMTPWKLNDEEFERWTVKNQRASIIAYIKYRPLFFLRFRFYKALYYTYLKESLEKLFCVADYEETHKLVRFFGIKIKFPKREYSKLKKENKYYNYKKNNIDITTIPPAEGQLRDIQLANIELLKELDYVCKQNGLKYWLDFGTLLGAVRHKGFIPWDDDIDVSMMREDYNKIIDAFNRTSRNPDIFSQQTYLGKGQIIIKVKHKKCPHLFVDIFPRDYANCNLEKEERIQKTKQFRDIRKKMNKNKDLNNLSAITNYIKTINKTVVPDIFVEHSDIQCGLEYSYTEPIWIYKYDTIFPIREIEFDGFKAMCVNKPEEYLSEIFGEYMSYPKKIGFGHSAYAKLSKEEKDSMSNLIKREN